MERNEIENIIAKIKEKHSEEDAYFGIFQYGGGSNESFIKANSDGYFLFIASLLDLSVEMENNAAEEKSFYIDLNFNKEWIDGDTIIDYIKPTYKSRIEISSDDSYLTQSTKDRAVGIAIFIFIILLIFSVFVGLYTMLTWFI